MVLKKYDILIQKKSKSPISGIIRKVTKDKYNHSMIVLDDFLICDTNLGKGVKVRTLSNSLDEFDCFRYNGAISSEQSEKIRTFIQKNINKKYDFIELFLQLFHIHGGDSKKYICISLIVEAFKYAGIDVGTWKLGFEQITKNNKFRKVNE